MTIDAPGAGNDGLQQLADGEPSNISRRRFLLASAGASAGALVLGFGIPLGKARAQEGGPSMPDAAAHPKVPAFLEIRPDNTVRLQCPFIEGGQGVFTAMAQIVAEELDIDPSAFTVAGAPADSAYKIVPMFGRVTGGSMSVRSSYETMRRIGASARLMLMQAASQRLEVPFASLTTEPGQVIHKASGRSLSYGEVASGALDMPVPPQDGIRLRDPKTFRWIGKPVARLDMRDKSTGKVQFTIDMAVEDMLHAAIQHAPRLGLQVGSIRNEGEVKAMRGVDSIHRLDGAVAVVAKRWWHARQAVEALQVDWAEPGDKSGIRYMPADFDSEAFSRQLGANTEAGNEAEARGDFAKGFNDAATRVEATYYSQYLHHAQLEPPSSLARFNPDGTLDLWVPNQGPEMFQADAAKVAGLAPEKVRIHSQMLGGFFGRHFLYGPGCCYPQAIKLAKAVGKPVKVIWSREEEFLRDPLRPMAAVRFRGGLDSNGMPIAIEAITVCEGASEGIANTRAKGVDGTAVEGLTAKSYAIPNSRIAQAHVKNPVTLGFWRSVGNSMNDFFYETFLDELADKGGHDPFEMRMRLLEGNKRLTTLLKAVEALSGGWKRGPFDAADGTRRARGVAMASPFGSQTAAIAEVSIKDGQVVVHDLWEAIDPGSIVNPAIVEAQVNSAIALGLSQVLVEEAVYKEGVPTARNYDLYPILPPDRMPRVHVKIVESGEPMGGVGEPPLPAVPPAVANAVSALTGKRVRSMPLSRVKFDT
nr:molybdopterin cofactor-binding domain-containing protein [Novosphingobium pentaromativorans]